MIRFGLPKVFNYDRGSQFIINELTSLLENEMVRIRMDGKVRALDNM